METKIKNIIDSHDGIILIPVGGMCNRLSAIMSSVMISKICKFKLMILWTQSGSVGFVDINKYYDLSKLNLNINIYNISIQEYNEIRNLYKETLKFNIDFHNYKNSRIVQSDRPMCIKNININEQLKYFQNILHTVCRYDEETDNFCKTNNIANILGVHIRAYEIDYTKKIVNTRDKIIIDKLINTFEEEIDYNLKFFLATDSKYVLDFFTKKYPSVIQFTRTGAEYDNKGFLRRDSQINFELGMKEFNILLETRNILGTSQSSYSFLAALKNRNLKTVGVIDPCQNWLNFTY